MFVMLMFSLDTIDAMIQNKEEVWKYVAYHMNIITKEKGVYVWSKKWTNWWLIKTLFKNNPQENVGTFF